MSWYNDAGLDKINFYLVAYVFLVCVLMFYMINTLYTSGRTLAMIVSGILFILIFTFFGLRWFKYGIGTAVDPLAGPWPPIINTCPDYFTLVNGKCADIIGVVNLNRTRNQLVSWTAMDSPTTTTDAKKYFARTYRPQMSEAEVRTAATAAANLGLTWEGMTNGTAVTFNKTTGVHSIKEPQVVCAPAPA